LQTLSVVETAPPIQQESTRRGQVIRITYEQGDSSRKH